MTNTNRKILVVADTNIFINALFGNGMFKQDMEILDLEERGTIKFAFSDDTRNELVLITARKITEHKQYNSIEFFDLLYEIFDRSATIIGAKRLEKLSTDKSDQMFIELAVETKANYLVTNDKQNGLLDLGTYNNVEILQPRKFLRKISKENAV